MRADEMDDDALSDGGDDELTQEDHGTQQYVKIVQCILILLRAITKWPGADTSHAGFRSAIRHRRQANHGHAVALLL